jgi:CheY-like chemotaxis protein
MPGMDGVEATMRLRMMGLSEPRYTELPIIALTANAVSGMKEMFLESGFNDFLAKPIDTVKLNATLEQWIPKSKQRRFTEDSKAAQSATGWVTGMVLEIEGLNALKGVRLSGGNVDTYYETLSVFYEDGIDRAEKLAVCLGKGDLKLYTVYVHALKSALANIGADKLSEAAHSLEMASQRGDLANLEANNDAFVSALELLLAGIDAALSSRLKDGQDTGAPPETSQFRDELLKLKAAIGDMDAGDIYESVDVLMGLAYASDVRDTVRRISKHILLVEYEEAEAMIESLLREDHI